MRKRFTTLALTLALASTSAMADDLSVSAGISHHSSDDTPFTSNLAYVGVGYDVEVTKAFSLMPEFRYSVGLGDDTFVTQTPNGVFETDIEVDRAYQFSLRGTYQVSSNVGLFLQPTYATTKYEASSLDPMLNTKEENAEWGAGAGFDYDFNNKSSVELLYERFGDSDLVSVGYRYKL